MNKIELFLAIMLWLHIAGGATALLTGLGAMLTKKGSALHRKFGKFYFWSMTAVFVGALAMAIGHQKDFLLMVGFFSYYMTVRGYRVLFHKQLDKGQKPKALDWVIATVSAVFILFLLVWGTHALWNGFGMGIPAIVFGAIGTSFLVQDVRKLLSPPQEKMHWWFSHIAGMGGSYISAVTAFLVVNIQIQHFSWILWILPATIGGALIGRTIRYYKIQFSK